MIAQELLDRLVLDRVLLAGVEIVVWLVAPAIILLLLAGLGGWTVRAGAVRRGEGLLALAWAAVSGAVLVIGVVAGLNLLVPVPRWSPVVVVVLGAAGLSLTARRLALTSRVLLRFGAVMGAITGLYRLGFSPLTYDAFLYHGVIVEWLGREALPQGFGLLHSRFAFNPGLVLLMPAFRSSGTDWTHHVLVELAVVGLAMVVLIALLDAARARRDVPLASLLVALVGAGALFLVLRQRGPGTDLAVAFTLVAAAAVAAAILRGSATSTGPAAERSPSERAGLFALLGMLAAFAILQKVSAAAVLVLLLAPILARQASATGPTVGAAAHADRTLPFVLPSLVLALVAGVLHTVRTFVISGCLAYPVAATCIERPWAIGAEVASAESASIRSWARDRSGAHPELLDTAWLGDWVARYVRDETFIVLAVGVAFGLLGLLLRLRWPIRDAVAVDGRRDGLLWASVSVSAVLWAASAPAPRFGIHLHLVAAALLAAPATAWALGRVAGRTGAAGRSTSSVGRPSGMAVGGVLAGLGVVGVLGVGMIAEGRQLPVSGAVPHPMRTFAMPTVGAADGWDYLAPVGSDQCGDAFPCAPSECDLVVDVSGQRLVFMRAAD